MSFPRLSWLGSILLAFAGVCLTLFLTWAHVNGSIGAVCSTGSGCRDVLSSSYGEFLGLPTAFYGFLFYGSLLMLFSGYPMVSASFRSTVFSLILALSTVGFVVSLALTLISLTVLGTTCSYCIVSLVLATLIFFGTVFWWIRGSRNKTFSINASGTVWRYLAMVSVVLLLVVGGFYFNTATGSTTDVRMDEIVALASGPHSIGNPTAPVRVVEFYDLACPYCRRFTNRTFPKIRKNYIETGKVLWAFRPFPLTNSHQHSLQAFSVLHTIPNHQYLSAKKRIMNNPKQWKARHTRAPEDFFNGLLLEYGLSMSTDAIPQRSYDKILTKQRRFARLGVTGTPTFMVNGELVQIGPYREWKRKLEALLEDDRTQ